MHESSHAVIGIFFHLRVDRMWVNPKTGSGRCFFDMPSDPVVFGCVLIAGSVGESIWCGRTNREITIDDYKDAKKKRISQAGMSALIPRVRGILRSHKKEVMVLAKALKKENHLGFTQVVKILGLKKNYWKEKKK